MRAQHEKGRLMKLKPLQQRWLTSIGKSDGGRLAFHASHMADLNALQALLDAKLIKIVTAFENDLWLTEITDAGREALAAIV